MSTKNNIKYKLHLALIRAIGSSNTLPIVESVNLILAIKGTSLSKIAKEIGVSRQLLYVVLSNPKKSKKVKNALCDALGFNLWESEN